MSFHDRRDAGRRLGTALDRHRTESPIVLGLPRGGVVVADEIARALEAQLDVWIARKLGAPLQPELGMGAIAEGGEVYLDPDVVGLVGATDEEIARVARDERRELDRRVERYREGRPPPDVRGRLVIVVDDGIATGGTMRAALRSLRKLQPRWLVVAVPVVARETLALLGDEADEVVCLQAPRHLGAIGWFYADFSQTTDEEVVDLLRRSRNRTAAAKDMPVACIARIVRIPAGSVDLEGDLEIPEGARGLVLFAHGSGSSRHSPRNRFVADALRDAGLATLLFDLLTVEEERTDSWTTELRFDVALLARRLVGATEWLLEQEELRSLGIGYFGASTGAAAALLAAAELPAAVRAVVSRGGRPDLAWASLRQVRAPTLLIVGADDLDVLDLNRRALQELRAEKRLELVPGATHLFEEPGALEEVARVAAEWFLRHVSPATLAAAG